MEKLDFIKEFYRRTCPVPAVSQSRNYCLSVNLKGASNSFVSILEEFVDQNLDKVTIRIRGQIYYLEVLNGKSMLDLFKSISQETDFKGLEEQIRQFH